LPEIIELKHYEKITDNKGKVYNIEIRGEKGLKQLKDLFELIFLL
jgi:hypothetical protein